MSEIGHFRVAVNLTMKARLSAKLFIWKLVLFAYEWKLIFITKTLHLASCCHNEVQSNSEMVFWNCFDPRSIAGTIFAPSASPPPPPTRTTAVKREVLRWQCTWYLHYFCLLVDSLKMVSKGLLLGKQRGNRRGRRYAGRGQHCQFQESTMILLTPKQTVQLSKPQPWCVLSEVAELSFPPSAGKLVFIFVLLFIL